MVAYETDCKMLMGYSTIEAASKCAYYHGTKGGHQMGDTFMVGVEHGDGTDVTSSGHGEGSEGGTASSASATAVAVAYAVGGTLVATLL